MITDQLGIPAPGTYPSPRLLRAWKSMPVWQAKRARAAWWREHDAQNGQAAPAQPTQAAAPAPAPARHAGTGRLTNEELAARRARRVELDDPGFSGTLTEEDLAIASPAAVARLMNNGQIERDLGGPPPQRQPGARR